MIKNLSYLMHNWVTWNKRSFLISLLRVPVFVLLPVISALLPKLMIDAINAKMEDLSLVLLIASMSILIAFLSWVNPYLLIKNYTDSNAMQMKYRLLAFDKLLRTDYVNLESYDGRKKYEQSRVFSAMIDDGTPVKYFNDVVIQILASSCGIVTYLILLTKLNPLLLTVVFFTCAFEYLLAQYFGRKKTKITGEESSILMRIKYFYHVSTDPKSGKDIRLYDTKDWFSKILAIIIAEHTRLLRRLVRQSTKITVLQSFLAMIREIAAYAFLIESVLLNKITVADFVFLFGIITGFSAWIAGLSNLCVELLLICKECDRFREFLDMPEQEKICKDEIIIDDVNLIEFRNIAFSYESSDIQTIKNINFTVHKGEQIAIVGENGAGKTTLFKILCGLYMPTSGDILINGISIKDIPNSNLFRLFGTVFQEYNFLPMTIAENISLCPLGQEDEQKLIEAAIKADILDKIKQLPSGLQTRMIKQVWEDAVDFSGGEAQRLLLARALYKNAPVLVLDEPTAALDPIAESKIYESYSMLMKDKISFFISHRLTSTQFCDRIIYLSNGQVEEDGAHNQLMQKQGNYWRMYQAQSYYYRLRVE